MRVLIVDDHADVRFLIAAILRAAQPPLQVVGEAADADAALELLDRVGPDAVVLDARLPRVDGVKAAARMLERAPGLRIVLCSGLVDAAVRERAAAAGVALVLSKDDLAALPAALRGLETAQPDSGPAV